MLNWLCQRFETQQKNAEKHFPLGQLQKHYNIPQLSHCHHNCTPGGVTSEETQARTHPGTHCTRHHSDLAEREATLKIRAHVAEWRTAIMQMPFFINKHYSSALPYGFSVYCYLGNVFSHHWLPKSETRLLVQKTPSTVRVYSNTQSLSYNTKAWKTF